MTPLFEETLPGGGHWSMVIKRGQVLRLTDLDGGANLSLLAFNAHEKTERLNLPDTLKCQHTARLGLGHCLYSDMGRVLLCIVADSVGWHDALGGVTNADDVTAAFGTGTFQDLRNAFHRNGYDNLLVELGKWGLSKRDLVMNVNFFSKVAADADARIAFVPGNSARGASVDLFAPMDTLVVATAIQHPLDPATTYAPRPVQMSILKADDYKTITATCRTSRPENGRGFELTERLYL